MGVLGTPIRVALVLERLGLPTMNIKQRLDDLADLLDNDPIAAADELDKIGDSLKDIAQKLRDHYDNGITAKGGGSDQVTMQVVGPDGKIKSEHWS